MAAMISSYGSIAAIVLIVARLLYSLARNGELPHFLSRMNAQHHIPAAAIATTGGLILLLALRGTYLWALALCAGATMVVYGTVCGTLLRCAQVASAFRRHPHPMGGFFDVCGILAAVFLLTQLQASQLALMCVMALLAAINWGITRDSYSERS